MFFLKPSIKRVNPVHVHIVFIYILFILDCPSGFYGVNCSNVCSTPYYGVGCAMKCECVPCDRIYGCLLFTTDKPVQGTYAVLMEPLSESRETIFFEICTMY